MLYSLDYKSSKINDADEVRCPWNQLGQIIDFIRDNPDKRYNILVMEKLMEFDKLKQQVEYIKAVVRDNYTITCGNLGIMRALQAEKFDRLCLKIPVSEWELFNQLVEFDVTDIWIDGSLGFDMLTLLKKKGDIKIRVAPTISPSALYKNDYRSPNSFFIRPEDINNIGYKNVVDIIDFQVYNQRIEDILFGIYKNGSCNFNIDTIIKGLEPYINNSLIDVDGKFAKRRSKCKQECMRNSYCHYCDTCFKIASRIENYADLRKGLLENK